MKVVRHRGLRLVLLFASAGLARGQEIDGTQTPNAENAHIKKSYTQEIGAGRENDRVPGSSMYVIHRDPFRSIRRGRELFQRKFTFEQGLGPRLGDGRGNIEIEPGHGAGLADSCAACHGRPRGAAGSGGDVATRPDSRDAPHLFGLGLVEQLADEMTADLRALRAEALVRARTNGSSATLDLVAKGVRFGKITVRSTGEVDTTAVAGVDPDLRVRPFFHQGGLFSMREFIVGALQAEMGLQALDPDLITAAAGGRVVTPSGLVLDGSLDRIGASPVVRTAEDRDGDGVVEEVPEAIVDYLEFYLLNYFKPAIHSQSASARRGRRSFDRLGCAGCHVQQLTINSDRRVADVETVHDPVRGVFNRLFATATPRFIEQNDGSGLPSLKRPALQPFVVDNFFSDLKRHDLGPAFHERNYDGTFTSLFVTEPLWGVATTAPYGHDGRSINLEEVTLRHGGEAQPSRDRFAALSDADRADLLAFLNTLVLFPPDDTASNLDPGDAHHVDFPQRAHGSIRLSGLFNDPTDPE